MTRALRGIASVHSQKDDKKDSVKGHKEGNGMNKGESIHPLSISLNNNLRTASYVVNGVVTVSYNITITLAALGITAIDSSTTVVPPIIPGSPEEQVCYPTN